MTEEIEDAIEGFQTDPENFDPKAFKMLNLLKGKEVKAAHARVIKTLYSKDLAELEELALIYVKRGLEQSLAMKVAEQLSAKDRLGAHMRDELGLDPSSLARPLQAAWISAASFAFFAGVPIAALLVAPAPLRIPLIAALSLVSLASLGAFGGYLGGAPLGRAALRWAGPRSA